MTTLVFYTVAMFGFAYVVGHSVISLPFREVIALWSNWLVTLIECPACLGFWLGLCAGANYGFTHDALGGWPAWLAPPAFAFYTAGANYLLARLTGIIPSPTQE